MTKYKFHKIPNYNKLKTKLMMILSTNIKSKSFYYVGTKVDDNFGIVVKGTDSAGIREFERFFSIKDINYYFYNKKRDFL